jgi:hypothetical protein
VISCSEDYYVGLFDGTDEVSKAVRKLTSQGTVWVNAAGNFADKHWYGAFEDLDGDGFNNFNSSDQTINFTAKRGEVIRLWLSWKDDWHCATQDYDLYLYAPDGSYTASDNPQEGYFGHKPTETICMVAPVDGVYQIAIKRYEAKGKDASFQLFSSHRLDEYNVPKYSLGILGSSADVITVGALNLSTLTIENSSSRGPTKEGRLKPDVVAPDNVTTISYWPNKFSGTSASAAYVAGCIALLMEKFGEADVEEAKRALTKNALDLGPKGPDFAYGYGLINISSIKGF